MSKYLRRKPSPGLIVAIVALVTAMSGVGYAASGSDKKSDKKIANKAAKNYFNSHIAGASVAHATTADTAGSANSVNGVITVRSPATTNPPGTQTFVSANCPTGYVATGGGAYGSAGFSGDQEVNASYPIHSTTGGASTGWGVFMNNHDSGAHTVYAFVICVKGTGTASFSSDTHK